ncbi:hypothetical protein [Mammaliicoccus sp. M-M49]|uniref:hypothetical protein n=1 Tax=Mammaliicoccus sp. M-M49 TaxID=2898708 RepID=UPI001EFB2C77|nr:hypothetical protein [Mammaliicoccus sp. M-M49]
MAYEYENDVISELEQMGVDYESNGYFNMSIEVEEVYAKAKAFDEIKKSIIQIKCNYKGNEERINKFIARETEYIMNREDK